jgi:biofilm PGA synthesis N-glycosyltransferase PgaC
MQKGRSLPHALPGYVLITPARNEAQFIESVIHSVLTQTVRPMRWVIVSDGSTDDTDEIVLRYANEYEWIEFVRMPERAERHFAGKALAFQAGSARVEGLAYDVIANLDADITFKSDYFAFLLGKLADDSTLGVLGTPYVNADGKMYDFRFTSLDHVSGACQVFRRECFESIGGYAPLKLGAIDCIAVISARMKGWKTRTFTEKVCVHHRKTGTAEQSVWRAGIKTGAMDYAMGNHPVWQVFRSLYQLTRKPYLSRGLAVAIGFLGAAMRRQQRPVSREFIRFHRREQMDRLKEKCGWKGSHGRKRPVAPIGIGEVR